MAIKAQRTYLPDCYRIFIASGFIGQPSPTQKRGYFWIGGDSGGDRNGLSSMSATAADETYRAISQSYTGIWHVTCIQ
jgi:hypothetical protein